MDFHILRLKVWVCDKDKPKFYTNIDSLVKFSPIPHAFTSSECMYHLKSILLNRAMYSCLSSTEHQGYNVALLTD